MKLSIRTINFLLVAAIFLTGSACSGPAPSTTDLAPSSGSDSGETVITFAAFEYQRQLFESLMETFHEQNPDITVQFVDLSQWLNQEGEWNLHTYLRGMAQAADTILLQGSFNLDMSRYFRDLRPLYESDLSFEVNDFWPGVLSACEDPFGNLTGLPMTVSLNGIFYDEGAFDKAGVPYPKPGWTWEDFQKTVTMLADKSGDRVKYGFYDQPYLYGSILSPQVSNHLRTHNGEVDAASLIDDLKWYIDLARSGDISGLKREEDLDFEWDERTKLFEDEALRPAMWIDSLISYIPATEIPYDPNNPLSGTSIDRFGLAPYPVSTNESANLGSINGVECASISSGSPNTRAAWAWLNFLSRNWIVMDKTQIYEVSRTPARQSVADSSGYWDLLPSKAIPSIRYSLEHGSYSLNYIDEYGDIGIALAKTIAENADFEGAYESLFANRPATPTPLVDNDPIVVATPIAPLPEGVTALKYNFIQMNSNELTAMKTLAEQFNQNSPDAKIIVITDFFGNPGEDWLSSLADSFDCFTNGPPSWPTTDTSSLLDLNSFLSNEPSDFSTDFSETLLDKFRNDGKLYALPASSQVQMVAYNADLLSRRGLELPSNDWSFDDFIKLASAAASTSTSDPSYGFMFSAYDEFISLGKGVKWADWKTTPPKVYLDNPEMLEHLKWIAEMSQENVLFDQESDWEKTNMVMTSGQLAFWTTMMGEENMWSYGMGEGPAFKIGIVPYPKSSGNTPIVSWSNDRGHYISAQSKNPRACWDWFKFLSEQPNLFTGVPARTSVADSQAWVASVGAEKAAAYRAAVANHEPMDQANLDLMQILWPLSNWRSQAFKAAIEGQELQPILITSQQKAEVYLACALVLDTSKPFEELNQDVIACLKQADPEGNW